MVTGFSFSPGGLLLPYHVGVLASLAHHGQVTSSTPLAGSSAGAIAVAAHAVGSVTPHQTLETVVRISEKCQQMGGARGRLLPLLAQELSDILGDDCHININEREGMVGLAHQELFPRYRPILETYFDTKEHLIDSICASSSFPFFSTAWPCRIAWPQSEQQRYRIPIPRVVVDGIFTVPRDRFGCPDFALAAAAPKKTQAGNSAESSSNDSVATPDDTVVDRTVTVSVLPHELVGLTASEKHNQISPPLEEDTGKQFKKLLRLGTQASSRQEIEQLFESGWQDAEAWHKSEQEQPIAMMLD